MTEPARDRRTEAEKLRDRMRNAAHRRKAPAGVVVDAVAAIAALDPHNVHHAAALAVLRQMAGTPKLIHPINLAEVLVLPVKLGLVDETRAILRRAGIRTVPVTDAEPLALAEARVTTGLKMPDACAYATAAARRLPLITFDRRLTIAARAAGIDVLGAPKEWKP